MIKELMAPLEEEIEGDSETARIKAENDRIDSDMVSTQLTTPNTPTNSYFTLSPTSNWIKPKQHQPYIHCRERERAFSVAKCH